LEKREWQKWVDHDNSLPESVADNGLLGGLIPADKAAT
jgi:hypothetical protein